MEIELLDAEGRPVVTHDHEWTRRTRRPPSAAMAALGVGAFTALVLLVVSGLVLSLARSHLEADLDGDVRAQATQVADVVARGDVRRAVVDLPDDLAAQVMQSPGVVVASTPGLADAPVLVGVVRRGTVSIAEATLVVDGRPAPHRVGSVVVPSPAGVASSTLVVVALPRERVDRPMVRVRVGVVVGVVMGTLAAATSAWSRRSRSPSSEIDVGVETGVDDE